MKKIFLLFLSTVLFSQNVEMTSYVLNKNLNDNDLFDFYVEVKWEGPSSKYSVDINNLPVLDGLELHGSGASNKVLNENNLTISKKIFSFKLKATRVGEVMISPISIKVTDLIDSQTTHLNTQNLLLKISKYIPPTKLDTRIIYYILIFAVIIAIIIFFVLKRAKKKKQDLEAFADMSEKYIETKILNKCSTLKNEAELVAKTSKDFISYYEEYLQDESVNKNELIPINAKSSENNLDLLAKVNEMRYSGEIPNTIDLEHLINTFKKVLKDNIQIRKDMEK